MTIRYRRVLSAIATVAVAGSLGLGVSACGKKKKMMDAVTTALMMPGVRVAVIPKQRSDLRIVVPPCSAAKVAQGSTEIPPGSNEVVVPQGTLTQTVAVQPCPPEMMMSGGMMMMPPPSSTILLTPGGTTAQQTTGMMMMMMSMQNQIVIPENSSITTVVLTPCATASMEGGGGGMIMPGTDQGLVAPTAGKGKKTIVAPPCTAPPPMM